MTIESPVSSPHSDVSLPFPLSGDEEVPYHITSVQYVQRSRHRGCAAGIVIIGWLMWIMSFVFLLLFGAVLLFITLQMFSYGFCVVGVSLACTKKDHSTAYVIRTPQNEVVEEITHPDTVNYFVAVPPLSDDTLEV